MPYFVFKELQFKNYFKKSKLPMDFFAKIWLLIDINKDNKIDANEFDIGCLLIEKLLINNNIIIPDELPHFLLNIQATDNFENVNSPQIETAPIVTNQTKLLNEVALKYYEEGNALFELTKYIEAIERFEKAISAQSNYEKAFFKKGHSLYNLSNDSQAIACYDKALSINSNYFPALIYKGFALQSDNNEEARELFKKANDLNANPKDAESLLFKGLCLDGLKMNYFAIEVYDKLIKLEPTNYMPLKAKADSLWDSGKNDEALLCLNKALLLNPNDYNTYYTKLLILKSMGRLTEALECCDKILSVNSNNIMVLEKKEEMQKDLNNFKITSVDNSNHEVKIEQNNPENFYKMAKVLFNNNQFYKAIECLDYIIKMDPNYEDSYLLKASILLKNCQYKYCIECCDAGLSINSNQVNLIHDKGVALMGLDRYNEAIEWLDNAFSLDPGNETIQDDKRKAQENILKTTLKNKKKESFFKKLLK